MEEKKYSKSVKLISTVVSGSLLAMLLIIELIYSISTTTQDKSTTQTGTGINISSRNGDSDG